MFLNFIFWALCVVLGLLPALWVWRVDKKSKVKGRWLPALLRGIATFLIAMLLLAPIFQIKNNTTQKPIVVWLQDNSSSMSDGLGENQSLFLEKKAQLQQQISDQYELVEMHFGADVKKDAKTDFSESATNIEQALSNVYQRYKGANLGAIILPSDGIFNEGVDPVYSAGALLSPIYSIAIGDSTMPKDISVVRVFANKVVQAGNSFEVAADVRFSEFSNSNHAIQLLQNGSLIQSKNHSITTSDQYISTSFEVKATTPGLYHYAITVPVAPDEKSNLNNKIDFYVQVVANEVKVAILNGGAHPDIGFIKNALITSIGYQVDVLAANTVPTDWNQYQSIIAHQPNLTAAQWQQIKTNNLTVWHILGNASTKAQMDVINPLVKVGAGRAATFQTPILQSAFTSFLMPVNSATVFAKLPPLETNVALAKATTPNEVILKSKENNADIWTVHNGPQPAAITIGEGIWRWGVYEFKDFKNQLVTQELIRQTMRTLNVPKEDKPFAVFLTKRLMNDNENISFTAELKNKTGQLVNDANVKLQIVDSANNAKEFEFEKFGNSYQLIIPKMGAGIYTYTGSVSYLGNAYSDKGTFAVENIPLEQIDTRANYALMYQLANMTKGDFFTLENMEEIQVALKENKNIVSKIITEDKREPFINYQWIFFVVLGLLTIEWLFRKYFAMQ